MYKHINLILCRHCLLIICTWMLFFFCEHSFAQAPPNDDCSGAITLTVGTSCTYTTFTNVNATASSGVAAPGCANYSGGDVWFKITVPASGNITIDSQTGVILDGGMELYTGTCSSLVSVSCDDDNSANGLMPITSATGLVPGSTVFIRFWEYGNDNNGTFGICATNPVPNNQDCLNSIPICQNTYSQVNSYVGAGNFPNEINGPISCLGSGEKNDVWYTFTAQTSGDLIFNITPNDLTDDYDWGVYDLTTATCADIYNNPALQLSCNFSGTPGTTGTAIGETQTSADAGGTNMNAPIPVIAGGTYVINVSNFSSTQNGYTIDFGATTAQIFDNVKPALSSLISTPTCGSTSITIKFSENILCSTVQATDFTLTGPGGPYTVTSYSSSGCSSGASYDNTFTINITPSISVNTLLNLSLADTVTDLCGNPQDTGSLVFIPELTITTAQIHPLCNTGTNENSATATPSSGTPTYTYLWSPGGQTSATATGLSIGNYTVTITDSNGCIGTDTLTIAQSTTTPITVNASSTNVQCNGGSDGIAVATGGGGTPAYTYVWNPSGQTTNIATGLTIGTYTVAIYDANGCTQTSTTSITQPTPITATIIDTNSACNGTPTGDATADGSGGTPSYSFLWSDGQTTQMANGLLPGNYTVTVNDSNGCTSTTVATVSNNTFAITVSPTITMYSGSSTTLTVTTDGGNYSYNWIPSTNLSCTNCPNPVASPNVTTTYTVIVTDEKGCAALDNVTVIIPECNLIQSDIFIPNAFSPNGDGENDLLSIYAKKTCVKSFNLQIYDRWGISMFKTNNINDWWDGTFNGTQANTTLFIYYCTITSTDNQTVTKKGNITILR